MELYFESDYAKISYDSPNQHIVFQWLTPPANDEFKEGCEKLLFAIQHFKTEKIVVDTRQQGAVHPELIEWMSTDWAERAIATGYTHAAIITPTDIFASMSLAEIAQQSDSSGVKIEYFDNMEKAIDWIKSQSFTKVNS